MMDELQLTEVAYGRFIHFWDDLVHVPQTGLLLMGGRGGLMFHATGAWDS